MCIRDRHSIWAELPLKRDNLVQAVKAGDEFREKVFVPYGKRLATRDQEQLLALSATSVKLCLAPETIEELLDAWENAIDAGKFPRAQAQQVDSILRALQAAALEEASG